MPSVDPLRDPTLRRWFPLARPAPQAKVRLFCFPHAGAGASGYREFGARLGPDIECIAVQLPGRETRIAERPVEDVEALAAELAPLVAARGAPRFALFGHSMGALIAFNVAHALRERAMEPVHLFVSGRSAPERVSDDEWHRLPDPQLLDRVAELGAMPDFVLRDPEMVALVLPVLRADLTLCERYRYRAQPPLAVPITALAGADDPMLDDEPLAEWAAHTSASFAEHLLPGDHFYAADGLDRLLAIVRGQLIGL
jgi:surfactin synthase thioesterase subunit